MSNKACYLSLWFVYVFLEEAFNFDLRQGALSSKDDRSNKPVVSVVTQKNSLNQQRAKFRGRKPHDLGLGLVCACEKTQTFAFLGSDKGVEKFISLGFSSVCAIKRCLFSSRDWPLLAFLGKQSHLKANPGLGLVVCSSCFIQIVITRNLRVCF